MTITYIALGSNLPWQGEEPPILIQKGITALASLPRTQVLACSRLYQSPPHDRSNQPDYWNAVTKLETSLLPFSLLAHLKEIEIIFGRPDAYAKWDPRTLDLDILLYENLRLTSPLLTIPHYDLKNRRFFVDPLLEIDPDCILPDESRPTLRDLVLCAKPNF